VAKFDDLPLKYQGNIEREAPFGGGIGEKPLLSDLEIADIVTFLQTLTDADIPVAPQR
jgi:cytochrome c peroxidase